MPRSMVTAARSNFTMPGTKTQHGNVAISNEIFARPSVATNFFWSFNQFLTALRELGVHIALDDFGTGYSSLTYLRRLSPDSIKIDGSFVREIGANTDSTSIVKSLIALSHDLGIKVVGEGIETAEQLHFLRRYDCEEGQGYLLCKPKLPSEIEDILLMANERKIVA